jgi:SagB-type dehydrogenase family enzyme
MGKKSREKKSRKAIAGAPPVHEPPIGTRVPVATPFPGGVVPATDLSTIRPQAERAQGGAQAWYLHQCNRGQQLLDAGQPGAAQQVFEMVLARLGESSTYERAVVLGRLGRCLHLGGRPELAVEQLRQAMVAAGELAPSDGVKELRGTLHSELGDALRASGRHDEARREYEAALKIAEETNDARARGVDLGQLGALALAEGRLAEARERYHQARLLFEELRQPAMEAVAWHQLGRVLQEQREWEEAERHYREAARIREQCGDLPAAAYTWSQLAILSREAGKPEAAEAWHRQTIAVYRHLGHAVQLGRELGGLASLLQDQPDRLGEARRLAEESVTMAHASAPDAAGAEAWRHYGVLADVIERQAASVAAEQRAALHAQARDYRQLQRHAPQIVAALGRLGESPSYGRAVILGRLGRCFHMGGRPDLAAERFRQAIAVATSLESDDDVKGLCGTLHSDLGDALRVLARPEEARQSYESALRIAEELEDRRGRATHLAQLGDLALAEGRLDEARERYDQARLLFGQLRDPAMEVVAWHQLGRILQQERKSDEAERHYREAARLRGQHGDQTAASSDALDAQPIAVAEPAPALELTIELTIEEDLSTEYVFEPDLLIDGRQARTVTRWTGEPQVLAEHMRPMLRPRVRTFMDEAGAIRFGLPPEEPVIERYPGFTVMRRARREVTVTGSPAVVWRLLRAMDGAVTIAAILGDFESGERAQAARLLAKLAETGVVDVSGRPIGRFLHAATKKGVLPGGGLEGEEVMRLATDGNYRAYPQATRIPLSRSFPDRIRGFHALTRARRSRRDYTGLPVEREDFDALLGIACGVTGSMTWQGRESMLRAYPSSGGLDAVEIYPVVFRVEGLEPGVYHYRAVENVLELVRPEVDCNRIVTASLPVEREMVAGAAAMICLTGNFPRHERKYGEGGYRMLIAEAGHVSQNLVLAATALGLSARPFGGVFDALMNEDLGLQGEDEQFLLSVLLGHARKE